MARQAADGFQISEDLEYHYIALAPKGPNPEWDLLIQDQVVRESPCPRACSLNKHDKRVGKTKHYPHFTYVK